MESSSAKQLSIVLPCHNEAGNIGPFLNEIAETLASLPDLKTAYEIIVVDDASGDATAQEVRAVKAQNPLIRLLSHAERRGQSLAVRTGVLAARAPWVLTMDGDGQSDPRDIPRLLAIGWQGGMDHNRLIMGQRTERAGHWSRKMASRFANRLRQSVLQDNCPDSACGFKLFPRAAHLELPFFDGMHRFAPALHRMQGGEVILLPVTDRVRKHGVSKYTNIGRALVGILDLFGILWLSTRFRRRPRVNEE